MALGAARLALAAAPAAPRLGVLAANASGEREAHSCSEWTNGVAEEW